MAAEELSDDTDPDGFKQISAEEVKQTIAAINEAVEKAEAEVSPQAKQKLQYGAKRWPDALDKYEAQEQLIGLGRNSYSKTDPDATFMRLKEDHMKNGQLKPAYNLQISTNNQYIVNYSLHQKTTDTTTLIGHLEQHKALYNEAPQSLTTDAGYGSEENFQYLGLEQVEAFVKPPLFDRNQNRTVRNKQPFATDKLHYNAEHDYYVCPMGQHMHSISSYKKTTANGFVQQLKKYQAKNCSNCPLAGVCHQQKGNRIIEVNHQLNRYKAEATERLQSLQALKSESSDVMM
jgi:hypothetical protein